MPVEQLAPLAMEKGLAACRSRRAETVHVVTHSLGGILVRYYLVEHDLAEHGTCPSITCPSLAGW